MFRIDTRKTTWAIVAGILTLMFHGAVRNIRKTNGNAVLGLLMHILQGVTMVAVMVFMMTITGMHRMAVRGDFVLYMMTGVLNFAVHSATLQAVAKSDGPTSAMMKHSPMNPLVAVGSAALGQLYLSTLSACSILFLYHTLWIPITIFEPQYVFGTFLLSWFSGIAVGMVFKAVTPWQPEAMGAITSLYARANMLFSGKMLLANSTPTYILSMYMWNPLFHTIDQSRGFTFENYHPHYSSLTYPIYVSLAVMIIGLLLDNFTNRHVSASWTAKR